MSMRALHWLPRGGWRAVALLVFLLASLFALPGCQDVRPSLVVVPTPDTKAYEKSVQTALAKAREDFHRILQSKVSNVELANAYGDLAMTYHAQDLTDAAEIAYKNSNVYLDGSALLVGKLENYTDEQLDNLISKPIRWVFNYVDNPNKLMFGSDWPLVNIARYKKAFEKGIPKEYWRKVFYENAMHVFKLPGLAEK